MTFRSNKPKAEIVLAELWAAIAEAKLATGETQIIWINDPEDEESLAPYRDLPDREQTGLIEVPGAEWYEAYQKASPENDDEYALEPLRRGAAAIRQKDPPPEG
jgi:hypothetical protein